jgi:Domain of unknown function (DUF4282)
MTTSRPDATRGFFSSLFDFSFTSNVTPKLIKIIYGIVMVVSGLSALVVIAVSFRANAVLGIFVLLVIAPLIFLFYVIVYRVMLEVVMSVFRIAENTTRLAAAIPGGAPSGVPTNPPFPPPGPRWGPGGPVPSGY